MAFRVRPMTLEDIPQVDEIEREAFPTQWPYTSYRRELENRLAHYLVAYEEEKFLPPEPTPPPATGLLPRLRGFLGKPPPPTPSPRHYIVGMVGFWVLYDEAHITTIAVREGYRRRGIGELLLIAAIEEAIRRRAEVMTLEVRISNLAAQALYEKYGFRKVGLRRGYYTDNGEDGYIMTTDKLTSPTFQAQFHRLKAAHAQNHPLS